MTPPRRPGNLATATIVAFASVYLVSIAPRSELDFAATTEPSDSSNTNNLIGPDSLQNCWIDPASQYHIAEHVLTVHNPTGQGAAFHMETGGPLLDDFRISLEFRFDAPNDPAHENGQGFAANVQVCLNYGDVFCQVFQSGACNLCYVDQKKGFHHIQDGGAAVNAHDWNQMEVEAHDGSASMFVNGRLERTGQIPIGTRGMAGLLVNFATNATTRIRNLKLTLLNPTPDQLDDLRGNAADNWNAHLPDESAKSRTSRGF